MHRWSFAFWLLLAAAVSGQSLLLDDFASGTDANWTNIPGAEYFTLFSTAACPGGSGTGPWFGLCFNSLLPLLAQLTAPLGTPPFHYLATGTTVSNGPFAVPAGVTVDAVAFQLDVTGQIACVSPVIAYTTY